MTLRSKLSRILYRGYRASGPLFFLVTAALALMWGVSLVWADGSGSVTVSPSPSPITVNSTANTLTFTYTAGETMNSGGISITVPSGWSAPQGSSLSAGYTTVSTTGTVGNIFDESDSATGWTHGTGAASACSGGESLDTTTFHSGTGSIKCINSNDGQGGEWYKNVTAQNWSGYTEVGFWIRSANSVTNSQFQFIYSSTADLANPITTGLSFGADLNGGVWTYVHFSLTGTRSSVASYGFKINNSANAVKNDTIWVDSLSLGTSSSFVPMFSGNDILVTAISLNSGDTITVAYGSGSGVSRATAPSTPGTLTFTTKQKTQDSGTLSTGSITQPTVTVVDTTAPAVSMSAPLNGATIRGSSVTLSATATDNVAIGGVTFYVDNIQVGSEVASGSGSTYSLTYNSTGLTDGSHTIKAVARDTSSNTTTSSSISVTSDNTAPTAAITYSISHAVKSGDSLVITATFSEAMANSPVPKVAISGNNTVSATNMTKSSSTVYTYTYTVGTGDGTDTVSLSVGTDAAGNIVTATPTSGATFTVDNTAPTNQNSVFSTSTSQQAQTSVVISSSGDSGNTVWFAPSGTTTFSASMTKTSASGTATSVLAPATPGDYKLFVVDAAGNISSESTATLTVTTDTTAPTAAITYSVSHAVKSGDSLVITATFSEMMANSPAPKIAITGANSLSATSMTKSSSTVYTYTYTIGSGNGTATVAMSVGTDVAGNVITAVPTSGATFTVDNTAPSITSSSIAASSGSTSVTVTWTTDSLSSSKVYYGTNSSYGSVTSEADTVSGVTSHSVELSSLVPCVNYHYSVYSMDAAGNSSTSSDTNFTTTGCAAGASALHQSNTSSKISKSAGGNIALNNGNSHATLSVPINFSGSDADFQIKQLDRATVIATIGSPDGVTVVGDSVFDLHALTDTSTAISSFTTSPTVTLSYAAMDVSGLDESTLKIYRYDEPTWTLLSACSVDTGSKNVTCSTDGFSTFAIFGNPVVATATTTVSSSGNGGLPPEAYRLPNADGISITTDPQGVSAMPVVALKIRTGIEVVNMALSNSPNFPGSVIEPLVLNKSWRICDMCVAGTTYRVYLKFYTAWGQSVQLSKNITYRPTKKFIFTRRLQLGSVGSDVLELQKYLNAHGFFVTTSGGGAPGKETRAFDVKTRAALVRFQEAHAQDILVPQNYTKGSGILGPYTMKFINASPN